MITGRELFNKLRFWGAMLIKNHTRDSVSDLEGIPSAIVEQEGL